VDGSDLINSPCVNGKIFNSGYVFTGDVSMISSTTQYEIKGDSKKNKCREEVDKLFVNTTPYFDSLVPSVQNLNLIVSFRLAFTMLSIFFLIHFDLIKNFLFPKSLSNIYEAIDYTSKLLKRDFRKDYAAFNDATYNICSMTYTSVQTLNFTFTV
jgi:hypothetical protein